MEKTTKEVAKAQSADAAVVNEVVSEETNKETNEQNKAVTWTIKDDVMTINGVNDGVTVDDILNVATIKATSVAVKSSQFFSAEQSSLSEEERRDNIMLTLTVVLPHVKDGVTMLDNHVSISLAKLIALISEVGDLQTKMLMKNIVALPKEFRGEYIDKLFVGAVVDIESRQFSHDTLRYDGKSYYSFDGWTTTITKLKASPIVLQEIKMELMQLKTMLVQMKMQEVAAKRAAQFNAFDANRII